MTAAIADYTQALVSQPSYLPAYYYRGVAMSLIGDVENGIGDFDRAIGINSSSGAAYLGRGTAKRLRSDDEGALADFNKAIELEPRNPLFLHARGCLHYDRRQWQEALADFYRVVAIDAAGQPLSRIRLWLVRSRLGFRQEATRELSDYLALSPDDTWERRLGSLLLGRTTEDELTRLIPDKPLVQAERRTQVWFYAGALRLLEGDRSEARRYFDQAIRSGRGSVAELQSAVAELQDLARVQ